MLDIGHLLRLSDIYSYATGVSEKTASYRVFGDSKKLAALRAGSDIGVNRFNSALGWFADNWPEGVEWPAGVIRPESNSLEVAQ
ncbi:hypothetical protein GOZ92_26160 [Agrobacterium vitis]|nr:hypothetical protein [Agrobacterium vitis]